MVLPRTAPEIFWTNEVSVIEIDDSCFVAVTSRTWWFYEEWWELQEEQLGEGSTGRFESMCSSQILSESNNLDHDP